MNVQKFRGIRIINKFKFGRKLFAWMTTATFCIVWSLDWKSCQIFFQNFKRKKTQFKCCLKWNLCRKILSFLSKKKGKKVLVLNSAFISPDCWILLIMQNYASLNSQNDSEIQIDCLCTVRKFPDPKIIFIISCE